jgi:adenylate cyclase
MEALNATRRTDGLEPLDFGLGLHVGDVMYGNIGVPERLEFSVIGPAANEVARLESLTKTLKRRVLVSGEFANNLDGEFDSLGEHALRGVGQALKVLAPR